jgi:MATE family multidrug resistance protein
MLPLWHGEAILLALGQEPEIAAIAGSYLRVAQWAMLPALVVMGLRSYLTVVGRAYVVLAVITAGAVLNGGLNYVLIFGHLGAPALGVVGAALATALTSCVMALALVG